MKGSLGSGPRSWRGHAAIGICALACILALQAPAANAASGSQPLRGWNGVQSTAGRGTTRLTVRAALLPKNILAAPPASLRLRGGGDTIHESDVELRSNTRLRSKVIEIFTARPSHTQQSTCPVPHQACQIHAADRGATCPYEPLPCYSGARL